MPTFLLLIFPPQHHWGQNKAPDHRSCRTFQDTCRKSIFSLWLTRGRLDRTSDAMGVNPWFPQDLGKWSSNGTGSTSMFVCMSISIMSRPCFLGNNGFSISMWIYNKINLIGCDVSAPVQVSVAWKLFCIASDCGDEDEDEDEDDDDDDDDDPNVLDDVDRHDNQEENRRTRLMFAPKMTSWCSWNTHYIDRFCPLPSLSPVFFSWPLKSTSWWPGHPHKIIQDLVTHGRGGTCAACSLCSLESTVDFNISSYPMLEQIFPADLLTFSSVGGSSSCCHLVGWWFDTVLFHFLLGVMIPNDQCIWMTNVFEYLISSWLVYSVILSSIPFLAGDVK